MGGDYNTVLDNIIDKSPSAVSRHHSKAEMALKTLIKDQALVDIWWLTHPKEKNFTFYSIPHNSHSRLDFFLVNKPWVDSTLSCNIGSSHISDHSPIELAVLLPQKSRQRFNWRLYGSTLQDEEQCRFIGTEIDNYLESNMGSVSSPSIWSFKSLYKRADNGYQSRRKKQKKENQLKLEALLKIAETDSYKNPTTENISRVSGLKFQLNCLYTTEAEFALLRTRAKFYEDGERASKLLASRLKKWKPAI